MLGKNNGILKDDKKGYKLLRLWVVLLILIVSVIGVYVIWTTYEYREAARESHLRQMSPNITESELTQGNISLPANATPTRVTSGIYVDRITGLSVRDSVWYADFYIWFKWRGNKVNPGETFSIVDGEILTKELEDSYDSGDEHYRSYRVSARITEFFDVRRFPVDDHVLSINIEDKLDERQDLIYVPDSEASAVSSRVEIPGYRIDEMSVIEKPHTYKTTFGDPRVEPQSSHTHSQLRAVILISRPDIGFFFRVFSGLFIAMATALVALFVKPTGPRVGLEGSALFVAIANMIISSNLVPDIEIIAVVDMVSYIGLIFIFLAIIESLISLYLYDIKGNKALSKIFDRVSFVILAVSYILINGIIVILAY